MANELFLAVTSEIIAGAKSIEGVALSGVTGTTESLPISVKQLSNLNLQVTGITVGSIRVFGNIDGNSLSNIALGSTISADGITNLSSLLPLNTIYIKTFGVGTPTVKILGNNI